MSCDELTATRTDAPSRSDATEASMELEGQAGLVVLLERYRADARKLVETSKGEESLDPDWLLRVAESILTVVTSEENLNKLSQEERSQLLVHAKSKVAWPALLSASRDALRLLSVNPVHKIQEKEEEPEGIRPVIDEAAELRRRLIEVVEGFRADRARSALLRSRIFGGRRITDTKSGWIHELSTIVTSCYQLEIEGLLTDAVAVMVPQFEAMQEKVTNARPANARTNENRWRWSGDVTLEHKTLHLVIDAFVSWARAVAPSVATVVDRRIQPPRSSGAAASLPEADADQEVDAPALDGDTSEEGEVVAEAASR